MSTTILALSALLPSLLAAPPAGLELDLPDALLTEACAHAATQNVLAAVNPKVFPGYWCVCADGQGFGYGNTYPSLDGHQMSDALLFLGQADTVKANWDYVRGFQRPDGQLPIAIFPAQASKDSNGGLYQHWVPGDPLRALADPTLIQNADAIYRYTLDHAWLLAQLPTLKRAVSHLASLTDADGGVRGAGYYVERPARIEYDGVAQCHAVDAFRRAAALNDVAGQPAEAVRCRALAERVAQHFRTVFWRDGQFAEYIHPQRGAITRHGLTDVDWSAIACDVATPEQTAVLWPKLKDEARFDYGGMPAGIATLPESYEDWEFTTNDKMDLAAMGRVWYLECWARARMGDGEGLLASIHMVCQVGRASGWYWRERYTAKGPHGAEKYCEYPANLLRIVERFVLGLEFELDGTLTLAPTVPASYWEAGFGQTLRWRGRVLSFRMRGERMTGKYSGAGPQTVSVALAGRTGGAKAAVTVAGQPVAVTTQGGRAVFTLPAATEACEFEVR